VSLHVSQDVWNGYYALDSGNKQLEASAALIKTAQSSLEVAEGRYKAGVGIFVDLLTAQAAASAARQARITAEQNWEVARAQLALALGKLSGTEPLATAGGALQ
jgi:outer membrane protein